ncbi:MAG: heme ABC transporter permease [Gammaproteobacteria bacterium]|jgi:heme exporter protein C
MTWQWFHRLSSPKSYFEITDWLLKPMMLISLILISVGLYFGLYDSPKDYQQGHSVRIMYLHVPTAIASMVGYVVMAVAAAVGYIWRIKLAPMTAIAVAPVGAAMTFLALATGSLWGKPTWGTWWVWDARLTSELILLFLYLGFIALHNAFEDREVADRAAGVLAMVGVINVPIIHYSVYWWNTLHQQDTISVTGESLLPFSMKLPLMLMIFGVLIFCTALSMYRIRNEVLEREGDKGWIRERLSE